MASESAQLEAISVGCRRRRSRDNFELSNAPEAVTESEHNSVHDSLNGGVDESETKFPRLESSGDNVDGPAPLNGQLEEELECLEPVKATAETTTEEPASNDNEKTDPGSAEEPEQPNAESEKELSNITREDSAEGQTGSDTQILSRKMEIPDDMTDDGDLPSPVAQGFSEAASAGEQREVSFETDELYISYIRKGEPPVPISACRVDVYARHFLEIDEHGDYYSTEEPVEIPQKYRIKLEEELFGLRKFRVEKHGEDSYDIVMVGCLNIYKYNTWIAGDTLKFEEPDYVKDTPVCIDPLALTFPAHMTVDEYKKKHWDSYKEMVKDKLTSAMRKADLDPADYGVDDDLCLSLVGDLGERYIILEPDDYPCEFCGSEGDCTCALESESEPVSESESESE